MLLPFLMSCALAAATAGAPTHTPGATRTEPPFPLLPPMEAGADRYVKRLDWQAGEPRLTIGLMERQKEVRFRAATGLQILIPGTPPKQLSAPANAVLVARRLSGAPAQLATWLQIGEFRFHDKAGLEAEVARWRTVGLPLSTRILGSITGIRGKVLDNRRQVLLLDEPLVPLAVPERQAALLRQHHLRTTVFEELTTPPSVSVELFLADGERLALAEDGVDISALPPGDVEVLRVEHNRGYAAHGFEDRAFRGAVRLVADRDGFIAVVNLVPLEQLLMGLVPAEIPARAHGEALRAQAVTARGEVLAKIGLKHTADPYLLCSEQHCAVYRGRRGEAAATNAAVEATRGEALFDAKGKLVDSVYSAVCGGHTENNEFVWGGPPDASLRGRPDVIEASADAPSPKNLGAFLRGQKDAACAQGSMAQLTKYRWVKRLTAAEVDGMLQDLGVGRVLALTVSERGVSGRARTLTVSGDISATQLRGELNIRKRLGMLNSAMFEVRTERDPNGVPVAFVFDGGGWGHGVGLCQTGAMGRAEAGQDYRTILRHYFNGAQAEALY
ncbi:MAG: SpoIID/LytB domain-containing protein [Myxococcaceae bacterium]